ncbi:MAG: glycogen synthase GlgA [Lagierella massiliensis]|nr:glycogen synthase GlgA [Lagierella massiliensis]
MNILYCTSEAYPFIKTGGLADVSGSLPLELKTMGEDVRVILPLYGQISNEYRDKMQYIGYYYVDIGLRHEYCGIFKLIHEEVTFYFLDNEFYFKREKIYGEEDDAQRFLFFSKAVTLFPKVIGFKPDVVHSNDWHTAMVNVFIRDFERGDEYYKSIKTIFTIHNLKYQGVFRADVLGFAGLSPEYFNEEALKYYDCVNFMKGGIVFCDILTTVSNTYSQEIQHGFYGEGLDGIIRKHSYKLYGIVNGLDYKTWNPKTDPFLKKNFDKDSLDEKSLNKLEIQKRYNLPQNKEVPMFVMVSRLVDMKGLDILIHIMDELLYFEDIQVIVLGTGNSKYENSLKYFQDKYQNKFAARIYYSNDESHMLYAGADFLLMPSLAEPCGISQLMAMRYATLPIVRETGGLKDTVKPFNKFTMEGTGFSFANINAHELLFTIKKAIEIYQEKEVMKKLRLSAMSQKNDWEQSAKKYLKLYKRAIGVYE